MQSYDGQLTFFEQEVQSFSRLLPDFLLPGPLAYMAASDSFVTSTAGLELVAYRYSSIAAANWEAVKQQPGKLYQAVLRVAMPHAQLLPALHGVPWHTCMYVVSSTCGGC